MSDHEPLDGINQITKPEDTFRYGFYFQTPGRIVGVALCVVGFFMITSFYVVAMFIGLALLIFGLYMVTWASGVDINYSSNIFIG